MTLASMLDPSKTSKYNSRNYTFSANISDYNLRHLILKPPDHSGPMATPSTTKNQTMLQEQIYSITFADDTYIKYLPPNKSYKMLVHINPMLDFREHIHPITKDVKKLFKALAKRKLSPPLKTLAIEQPLKSKYHATHLGVFNERQLTAIYGKLNKAMRQAIGLLPNFPTKGIQRPLKEAGLGLSPMRDRSAQMGIDHLTRVMNKDTNRGFKAHAHVHRLLSQCNYWPHEAIESNPLKLPTLRILRLASAIPGLEFDRLPSLHQEKDIATIIR